MRRLVTVVFAASLLACPKSEPGQPIPPAADDERGPPSGAADDGDDGDDDDDDDSAAPRTSTRTVRPEPDLAALEQAATSAATLAGLSGSRPSAGPKLGAPVPGYKRLPGSLYPKPNVPKHSEPYLVDNFELLFAVEPWATIDSGDVVVRFSTRRPTEAAALYVGLRLDADPLAPPRHRIYEPEKRKRAGPDHELRVPMAELLDPRKDVDHVRERGFGELSWQTEVHYPDSGSTVLYDGRLAFGIEGETVHPRPTVVLGPLLHQITATSAVVSFETNVPTTAAVAAGDTEAVVVDRPATRHEVRLTGLTPNATHPLRVVVSDGQHTSHTPTRPVNTLGGGALTVAILSDSRSGVGPGMRAYNGVNASVLGGLMTSAVRHGAEAIFFPGDLIDGYVAHRDDYVWQLQAWLRVVEPVHGHVPVYTGMGNHEALIDVWSDGVALDKAGSASAEAVFAERMVNPGGAPPPETADAPPYDETVYGVDLGSVHFVMLNTNYWITRMPGHPRFGGKGNREGVLMDGQLAWLERDLKAARERGVEHIVVMGHEPAWPAGGHTKDAMWWNGKLPEVNAMRERFWTILAEHDVLAYVSGDEHNYSRALIGPETVKGAAGSVYSVISGGSGAPYYALRPPKEYADRVQAFSAEQHYTLWTFEPGQTPRLRVYGLTGGLIEDVRLDEAGPER